MHIYICIHIFISYHICIKWVFPDMRGWNLYTEQELYRCETYPKACREAYSELYPESCPEPYPETYPQNIPPKTYPIQTLMSGHPRFWKLPYFVSYTLFMNMGVSKNQGPEYRPRLLSGHLRKGPQFMETAIFFILLGSLWSIYILYDNM